MENKQLDTKDLLMNKKEELIWRVIDNVISCCAVTRIDGAKSITREDVVGKSREENVVLTRCLVVEHIEDYKTQITRCEEVLKELNPQFAKDKARDERIAGIETEVAGIKGDIAKILAAVTK